MKLKTLIMLGAVIVGSGALLGCGHDNSQANQPTQKTAPVETLPDGYHLETNSLGRWKWYNGADGMTAVYDWATKDGAIHSAKEYAKQQASAENQWHDVQ